MPDPRPPDATLFAMIADERRQLADLAETLTDEQLGRPSLVPTWTVKDVLAHLTLGWEVPVPRFLWAVLTSGGFDKAADKLTWKLARRPTKELVASLRRNAEHRFVPPGGTPAFPLTEVLVHGLDLRWPLGVRRPLPEAPLQVALELLFKVAPGGFTRRAWLEGVRFEASDRDWSHGSGSLLRGPTDALVLAATGRRAALDELTGEGVEVLRARFGPAPTRA